MKTIILLLITSVTLACCKKGIEHDMQYIRGRLFITDTITDNKKNSPVANKKVLLSKEGDTLNFIYSTVTDNEGYFNFDLLSDQNDRYTVIAYDTVGNVHFMGKANVNRGDKDVVVVLNLNQNLQNGFILYVKDELNGILPSVTLNVYNNISLATLNNSSGVYLTMTSDANGKSYKFNLPVGDYYINATKIIDTVTYQRFLKKIHVDPVGFTVDTMTLIRDVVQNGFVITLKDSLTGSLAATNVRLYNSYILSMTDDTTTAIGTFISDANGKIFKTNLVAGTYYLNARKLSGSETFSRIAKLVNVPVSGIVTDTMILNRNFPIYQNGFTIETRDSLNGIMPTSIVYLYNSAVLATDNVPGGAIRTLTTDIYGKASSYNLPSGNYFLNAKKTINDSLIYEKLVEPITIPVKGMVTDTIILTKRRF